MNPQELLDRATVTVPEAAELFGLGRGTVNNPVLLGDHARLQILPHRPYWDHGPGGMVGLVDTATDRNNDVTIAVNLVTPATKAGGIGAATIALIMFREVVRTDTTAGNIQFQAAQNTADASDTIVRLDSYIELRRVA